MAMITLISVLIPATQAEARSVFHGLVMPPKFYKSLAQCETGKNPDGSLNWDHQSRSYTGGFGIYRGTWKRWSNSSSAKGKSPRYQAEIVDNIAFQGFTRPDGTFQWPVGPWGWGAIKAGCMGLDDMICNSKHPKVQKWKGRCR